MMSQKKNKLSIVMVFIMGTTMLSSLDKAWGMVEESRPLSPKPRTRGAVASSSKPQEEVEKKMLVGTSLAGEKEPEAARAILTVLDFKKRSERSEALPWISDHLQCLTEGSMGRVMVEQKLLDPQLKKKSLIRSSLEAIKKAQEDPYDSVTQGQTRIFPSYSEQPGNSIVAQALLIKEREGEFAAIAFVEDMANKKLLEGAVRLGKSAVKTLLLDKLPKIIESHPTIVSSLLARFPQSNVEKESEETSVHTFKQYFGMEEPSKKLFSKKKKLIAEQEKTAQKEYSERCENYIETLLFFIQINKDWEPSKLSSSNSNSIASPLSAATQLRADPVPGSSSSIPLPESLQPFSLSSSSTQSVEEGPRFTYRTTGANPNAMNKQSATSIKLSNREMQDAAYQLIVTHRTKGNDPRVRIFNPSSRTYINLGTLPSSVDFSDTPFDLTSWAKAVRHDSALESVIATYVSFLGESDIHSFTIESDEKTLKEVIFGDKESESQSGVHVYAPETDGDANAWSEAKKDDIQQ